MGKKKSVSMIVRSCTGRHFMVELTQEEYDNLVKGVENRLSHHYLPQADEDIEFRYKDFPNET